MPTLIEKKITTTVLKYLQTFGYFWKPIVTYFHKELQLNHVQLINNRCKYSQISTHNRGQTHTFQFNSISVSKVKDVVSDFSSHWDLISAAVNESHINPEKKLYGLYACTYGYMILKLQKNKKVKGII